MAENVVTTGLTDEERPGYDSGATLQNTNTNDHHHQEETKPSEAVPEHTTVIDKRRLLGFTQVGNWVLHSTLTINEQRVWWVLVSRDFGKSKGKVWWPDKEAFVAETKLKERTVERALAGLKRLGLVTSKCPGVKGGGRKKTIYTLHYPDEARIAELCGQPVERRNRLTGGLDPPDETASQAVWTTPKPPHRRFGPPDETASQAVSITRRPIENRDEDQPPPTGGEHQAPGGGHAAQPLGPEAQPGTARSQEAIDRCTRLEAHRR